MRVILSLFTNFEPESSEFINN